MDPYFSELGGTVYEWWKAVDFSLGVSNRDLTKLEMTIANSS
jgi:hypothetical protein